MVMPLGDIEKTEITPIVNYVLIALNILVFLLQSSRPEEFTIAYAATPYEITHNEDLKEPVRIEPAKTRMRGTGMRRSRMDRLP